MIAILVGLLLPSLSMVRESTRRLVCSSNVRQVGLGLAMFADDNQGQYPSSVFVARQVPMNRTVQFQIDEPQNVLYARVGSEGLWDGLGLLFIQDYLTQFGVFYCPSHQGNYPLTTQSQLWGVADADLVLNYQYRASTSEHNRDRSALVSDGLRTREDYSHKVGTNVLRADYSVGWFSDPSGSLVSQLPSSTTDTSAADKIRQVWQELDR